MNENRSSKTEREGPVTCLLFSLRAHTLKKAVDDSFDENPPSLKLPSVFSPILLIQHASDLMLSPSLFGYQSEYKRQAH